MWRVLCLVFVLFSVVQVRSEDAPPQGSAESAGKKSEKKLSDTITAVLDHYKQADPVGLPGAPIPDPMSIPAMTHSLSIGKLHCKNVQLFGLKKFRIDHVNADIAGMKVEAALSIDKLHVTGNYTLSTWLSRAKGPFTVNLTRIFVTAVARLEVEKNGQLEAQEIDMDIKFRDISMDFQGLGFFAGMFQGVMNSVGTFVFDSIKPFVLREANKNIRADINKEVKKIPQKFPNSISPLDQLVIEMRKKVRTMGYDPYKVPDYNNSVGVLDVFLTHTWLYGLTSFHRTKDITVGMRNNTLHAFLELGTQRLTGTTEWEVSLVAGMMTKDGNAKFTVEYIRVHINASQSLDTSHPPRLDDIQLELGNIQVRFNGLGTVDYAIEFGVNVLPNLLRYQIMDALEKPLRIKIQEALNQVNVEKVIKENADKFDRGEAIEFLN